MTQELTGSIGRGSRLALGVCAAASSWMLATVPADAQYWFSEPPSYRDRVRPRIARPAAAPKRETVQVAVASKPSQQVAKPAPAASTYPLMAVISISAQRVTIYDKSGSAVVQAPISSGQAGHRTPLGIFSVIQKERHHASNIYSGAPMPYMQRITWSGIAFHEGHLPGYPASHGCIRMPGSVAAKLFGMTKVGMRVVVAPHDVAPSSFSHPALFEPLMTPGVAGEPARRSTETTTVRVAAGEPANDAGSPGGVVSAFVNPHQRALANRVKTKAAHVAAVQGAKMALEESQRASAEANQAALDLRTAQASDAAARAKLVAVKVAATGAVTPEAQAVYQQSLSDAETAVADATRLLKEATQHDAELTKQAFAAAVASRDADEAIVQLRSRPRRQTRRSSRCRCSSAARKASCSSDRASSRCSKRR